MGFIWRGPCDVLYEWLQNCRKVNRYEK
jgi:hypothetical protein